MIWKDYSRFLTIRKTEEALLDLYTQGLLFGTVHTCIGQEPVALGVVDALDREKDVIWSNHRGHGHYLAYSDDVEGLIAEVMGRATGVCKGIGGSQHLHAGNFYTNGVLGGTVACAVGAGFAEKMRGGGAISAVFMGDGALGEGVVYESMNLAARWELPVLFILEHNRIAQTTPFEYAHAGNLADRPAAFGIDVARVQADSVSDVRQLALQLVEAVRSDSQPRFLIADTYRLAPHSKGDDTRSPEEINALRKMDPLRALSQAVEKIDPEQKRRTDEEIQRRVATAVETSISAPFLNADSLFRE